MNLDTFLQSVSTVFNTFGSCHRSTGDHYRDLSGFRR
jgi:hypothetical protein